MIASEAERLIAKYSKALNVKPPKLRVKRKMQGCMYNAITHRIVAGGDVLGASESALAVTFAHEVGHASQRREILFELVTPLTGIAVWVITSAVLWAIEDPHPIIQTLTFFGVLPLFLYGLSRWRNGFEVRYVERELRADAISASQCGAPAALSLLRSFDHGESTSSEIRTRLEQLEALCEA